MVKCKFSLPNFWSQVWWANQEISILQVPNWDMLCLFALDFTYKSKIRWLVFNSRRIAMGKYKSKKFWNGVIWCLWACTFCDDNFAELSSVFGILYFGVFWILLGYFICFWLKHHRKLQKTGGKEFHFAPLHLKSKVGPLNTLFGGMLGSSVAITEIFLFQFALIQWK